MKNRALIASGGVCLFVALVAYGEAAAPQQPSSTPTPPPTPVARETPAPPSGLVASASDERALLDRYCVSCHNEKARAAGMDSSRKLTLDKLDLVDVSKDAATWESVVRKLRAGMMPPPGVRRPEPATFVSMISWVENELDRRAVPYMPPPGLHRLNRTEYANVVRDLLNL
ncbi:MAG: hypothetical protein ACRD1Q_14305, partial [Vicinamibacterales bacterium]